ncbi:MAG: nitrite reductase large subunit NirB [Nocardiaceae bacterium]|nr:nitrite reductase large subunit NirB [Nocardiaceae bacterium]
MTSDTRAKQRLLVVGNGMAGARTVEEILARGGAEQFDITMIGDEPYGNYNRIMLSHVLAGHASLDDEDVVLNPMSWYTENGVKLYAGDRATRLDRFGKVVTCESGREVPYDILIIATGSTSFFPNIDGLRESDGRLGRGVFGFRNIADTNGMLQMAEASVPGEGSVTAVVIGGGLLGLEAAYGLRTQGLTVDVVHSPTHLMNQQLDERGGKVLRTEMEKLGIGVHTGKRTTAVHRDENGHISGVEFADGGRLTADMVVVAAGIRPSTSFAQSAGLVVERGIIVDDQMRCEDESSIYAVGECCEHRGETYGLVAPVWEQSVVLADYLTGTKPHAAYHGSVKMTKLKVAGIDVAAMGVKGPEHEDDEFVQFYEPSSGVYKSIVVRDDKLIGAMLLGDISKAGSLQQAFESQIDLPKERISLLFDLGPSAPASSVADLPNDAQICNCNGVSKGTITECVHSGAHTLSDVVARTRAGKGCGSCKGMVKDIIACALGGALADDPSADWYVPSIPMTKPELIAAVRERGLRSVSEVVAAFAPSGEDANTKMPLASLLRVVWGPDWVDERGALFINDRVHANIQKDGTFSVVPQMQGGVTTPDQLRKIADVADKYSVPMVKVTGGQRIDLLGVKKEDLPKVWQDLGMPSGFAYGKSFRTVKTCVGSEFCRYGLGDSTNLGIAIEQRFQGLETPAKLKLAVAGCPRNCSEALCKDFGVVSIGDGKWEIYIGGAAGAHIRKGDVFATAESGEEVLVLASRFIQYYRENARWLERTYDWVPRIGLEELQRVLVRDEDGICAGLEERMQASVDGYRDPWATDAAAPRSVGQFSSSLPLLPLPMVPVR